MTPSLRDAKRMVEAHRREEGGGRSVPEWVGASPDSPVPPRVRLRVFEREGGVCWLSKRKIAAGEPWDLDHKVALCNGGQNREANLAPALRDKHRQKTALDVAERVKTEAMKRKHLGIRGRKSSLSHPTLKRKMDGSVVPR